MLSQTVLVVDDEPDMRMAMTHALSRSGFSVESASNGFEALDKFKPDRYGMVITDIKMPEMSGMEFLGKIKKISPLVPVIMVTAYGTINNAVEAMQEGAADYIIKPFSSEILETAVNKVFGNSNIQANKNISGVRQGNNSNRKKFITRDPKLLEILKMAESIASSNATVLIQGESGTGKEVLASVIHQYSSKSKIPYIAVNCAALPESLAESELFGHEKGSFTGAVGRKKGKFELAAYGTVILDEISEMPMSLQAKLLRVLQEREIDRIGGAKPVPMNARIIAISNVDLKNAVKERKFREDLYYRVNVIPFTIPPLRERKGDIPLLADHFLKKYCLDNNKKPAKISQKTIELLLKYDWKGNVRELENVIERAVLMGKWEIISPQHLFTEDVEDDTGSNISFKVGLSVKEMEKELIYQTLQEVNNNKTRAAKILGISIRTLRNKLNEYKDIRLLPEDKS